MSEMLLNLGGLCEMEFGEQREINSTEVVVNVNANDVTPEETEKEDYDIIEIHSISENINSYVNSIKRKKYVMHSLEYPDSFFQARTYDIKNVAKSCGVPLKSLKRWVAVGPDRRKGGGRKVQDPEMERKLHDWYENYHLVHKHPVSSTMFKAKALEFSKLPYFSASNGWLEKVKKKYNLQWTRSSASKVNNMDIRGSLKK